MSICLSDRGVRAVTEACIVVIRDAECGRKKGCCFSNERVRLYI